MREQPATADSRLASLAGRQRGVVTYAQLVGMGIDKSGIDRRVKAGRLHRLHRGVYAVGHTSLSWRGLWLAAVLAMGDDAALSHTSAAALWEFLRPISGPIHVTVVAQGGRSRRRGLQIHRSSTLAPSQVTRRHGIAVTIPARTIEDIRPAVEPYLFRRALRQAELAGHRVPLLSATKRTRSDLELRFLALCADHDLPRPLVNHRGSVALEDDHRRDLALRARGIEMRRYTGDQLEAAPEAVVADLREALGPAS